MSSTTINLTLSGQPIDFLIEYTPGDPETGHSESIDWRAADEKINAVITYFDLRWDVEELLWDHIDAQGEKDDY